MASSFAIIIVGYNRIESMLRTVDSVKKAYYGSDNVDLIISLDNCGDDSVYEAATKVTWEYGDIIVRHMLSRKGLKEHILSCGEFLDTYEAVAILEDDIIVAPGFYSYMKAAVEEYKDNMDIAGISLYSFEWSPIYNAPFYPKKTKFDNYFIQYAQSWGQVWMRKQWKAFRAWYEENINIFDKEYDTRIPRSVFNWNKSSWLKYHISYCIDANKYFVYPYDSYTSNFTECGEHYVDNLTRFQVSLQHDVISDFRFATLEEGAKYDGFLESCELKGYLKEYIRNFLEKNDSVNYKDEIVVDLYGNKEGYLVNEESSISDDGKESRNHHYVLTTRLIDKPVIKSWALSMRPQEDNILFDLKGNVVFLYDMLGKNMKNSKKKGDHITQKWDYINRERFLMLDELWPVSKRKFVNLLRSLKKKSS